MKLWHWTRALYQVGFILGAFVFFYFGYKHLNGNSRFLSAFDQAKTSSEKRSIAGYLRSSYPDIESIYPLETLENNIHIYQVKLKNKVPIKVARIFRDLPCASCKDLDFLLVTDFKGTVQKVQLLDSLEVDGKKINAAPFLEQFKDKDFNGPIQVGREIQGLSEDSTYSIVMAEAISEVLPKMKKIY